MTTITETTVEFSERSNSVDGAKADPSAVAAQPGDPAAVERPSWLPEGYTSVEEYVAAAEAAGVGAKAKAGEPEPKVDAEKIASEGDPEKAADKENKEADPAAPQTAEDVSKSVGFDITPFAEEFAKDGKLSDASYKALEEKGFGRDMVDTWTAGQQARVAQWQGSVHGAVGGKETYDRLVAWAKTNLAADEYGALEGALTDARNLAGAKLAIQGVKAQYEAKEGREARLVGGSASKGSQATDTYASRKDHARDVNSERYRTDPAFRTAVTAKALRSTFDK